MSNPFDRTAVEQAIGYAFTDETLLFTAFTHPSYSNEHQGAQSFERLECLGDKVLGFIVMDALYRERTGDEGDLTDLLRTLVSKEPLTNAAKKIGIGKFVRYGKGTVGGDKTLSDVYESVVAAVYLDGGMGNARDFVRRTLLTASIQTVTAKTDFKSRLNEYAGKNALGVPTYVWDEGDQTVKLVIRETIYAEVNRKENQRKQAVEQCAAEQTLIKLHKTR